jgi:hypothetical protein
MSGGQKDCHADFGLGFRARTFSALALERVSWDTFDQKKLYLYMCILFARLGGIKGVGSGKGDGGNNQPRPEDVVLGRPPRGGHFRVVAPVGGVAVGRPLWGRYRLLKVQLPLTILQLLLVADVLPHTGLIESCSGSP